MTIKQWNYILNGRIYTNINGCFTDCQEYNIFGYRFWKVRSWYAKYKPCVYARTLKAAVDKIRPILEAIIEKDLKEWEQKP